MAALIQSASSGGLLPIDPLTSTTHRIAQSANATSGVGPPGPRVQLEKCLMPHQLAGPLTEGLEPSERLWALDFNLSVYPHGRQTPAFESVSPQGES